MWICGSLTTLFLRDVLIIEGEKIYFMIEYLLYSVLSYRFTAYTVRLLSFRADCAERILRAPSGGHPQKHVGECLDTLCA